MVKEQSMKVPRDKRPHFFKIMLPGLEKIPLRIPPDFMEHISKKESAEAILKDPIGRRWSIKLSKTAGYMYFEDGWQKFVSAHSLGDSEFLLFRYDGNMKGNMKFKVKIFDKSGCERDYVFGTGKCKTSSFPNGAKNQNGQSRSSISSSDLSQSKTRNCYPGMTIPSPKPDELNKVKENAKLNIHEVKSENLCHQSRRKTDVEKGKTQVQKATESFTSKYPYFSKLLCSGNVEKFYFLRIPRCFGEKNLPTHNIDISLLNPEGHSWKVKLLSRGKTHVLSAGWKAFANDNMLTKGDTCIFELIGKAKMQVHISRVRKSEIKTEERM